MHRDTRDQEQGRTHMPQVVQPSMRQRDLGSILVVGCLVVGLIVLSKVQSPPAGASRLRDDGTDLPGSSEWIGVRLPACR